MDTKVCSICGKEKLFSDFYVRKIKDDIPIYRNDCKYCISKRSKKYTSKNSDKIKVVNQKYYQDNKEKINIQNIRWALENPDKNKDIQKRYYQNNKVVILVKQKEKYAQNIERERERNRKYRQNNLEIIKLKRTQRVKIERQNNPVFKLKSNISRAIRNAFKKLGSSKNRDTFIKYVQYTIQELKHHLESQFETWMTWQNWGIYNSKTWNDQDQSTWTWQLDHIIPQSDLPYTSMEDDNFKKCWALENLRPLGSKQNFLDGVTRARHKKDGN